ncbi:MAG TPA: redoxin domain-containing protein [Fibrobacteria bacterium]|nr:redoxin domain-containing protein [Fibrobacteria bacterium]
MKRTRQSAGWVGAAGIAALLGVSARSESITAVRDTAQASGKAGTAAAAPAKPKPAAWLGVSIVDVPSAEMPAAYAHSTRGGAVRIQQVFKGTSADQAGLKDGDVILSINRTPLEGRRTLLDTIHSKTVGDVVELRLGRDGKAMTQKMALSPRPEDMRSITRMLVGSPAPALDGKYYSGDAGSLSKNKGKVVLLDFWATWCGPCRATIPALDAVYKKYRDKGLEVIGISSENLEDLKAFQAAGKQGYPLFNDVGQLTTRQYQAYAYPTLVVIDRQGIIQRIEVGAHPQAAIEKWVLEYL